MNDQQLRNQIDAIFAKYDTDGSQTLNSYELANFFNDLFKQMGNPKRINNQQAEQAVRAIDKNNDGRASKIQIFNAMKYLLNQQGGNQGGHQHHGGYGQQGQDRQQLLKNKIDYLFQKYDRDNTGSLDEREFPGFFGDLCRQLNISAPTDWNSINQIARQIDTNYDGRINRMEVFTVFKKVMKY